MFVIVAYDLSDDRRRGRLLKTLRRFGTPVQRSVVECWLSQSDFIRMKTAIERVIITQTDQVRYYVLCEVCARRRTATSASIVTTHREILVV